MVKFGLYLYYGKIEISGLENIPKNEAVLFLPNHQGALMDVLLIVTDCQRKPFFLTRSDVFKRPSLKKLFSFLRMLPIYRIRDGRASLKKNQAVFELCAQLFIEKQALVMFPEANHNLKRRVRPLSKGFTRIVFNALEKTPELKIHLVPIGMNYSSNTGFPDRVALRYGIPVLANELYDPTGIKAASIRLKTTISDRLKMLTTHIAGEESYDATVQQLDALKVDYMNPSETNAALENLDTHRIGNRRPSRLKVLRAVFKGGFTILNFPMIAIWRCWIKPKVWEPEFTSTLRFGFSLLAYPIYYLMLFVVIAAILNATVGLAITLGLFLFNWCYVRWY